MTDSVTYYSQSNWTEEKNTEWHNMMETLDTMPNSQAALMFIFEKLLPFLQGYVDELGFFPGNTMQTNSQLEADVCEMKTDFDACVNGQGSVTDVEDAADAANNYLMIVYTDPAVANPQIQQTSTDAIGDLFGIPNLADDTVPVEVTTNSPDGGTETTTVDVPQINYGQPGMSNDVNCDPDEVYQQWSGEAFADYGDPTGEDRTGNDGPYVDTKEPINPTYEGYQAYLAYESQATQNLEQLSDNCDSISSLAQTMYQQDISNNNMLLGQWNQFNQNTIKQMQYWIQNEKS